MLSPGKVTDDDKTINKCLLNIINNLNSLLLHEKLKLLEFIRFEDLLATLLIASKVRE